MYTSILRPCLLTIPTIAAIYVKTVEFLNNHIGSKSFWGGHIYKTHTHIFTHTHTHTHMHTNTQTQTHSSTHACRLLNRSSFKKLGMCLLREPCINFGLMYF